MKRKVFVSILIFMIIGIFGYSRPKYYISIGYGSWSLNLLRGVIEEKMDDVLRENLQDNFKEDYPNEVLGDYTQDVNFDSSGGGVNFQIRIFPGGEKGSFSLGFSYFRVDSKIMISGDIRQNFISDDYISANAEGNLIINYSAFVIDMRWDLFPQGKIHPYISLGGGISPLKGSMDYSADGGLYSNDHRKEGYTISESKDLTEVEDINFSHIPVILINLGIRVDVIKNGSFFLDGGIWNGFMIKGGIAYSF